MSKTNKTRLSETRLISIQNFEYSQPSQPLQVVSTPYERAKWSHSKDGSVLNRLSKVAIRHQPSAPTVISAISSRAPSKNATFPSWRAATWGFHERLNLKATNIGCLFAEPDVLPDLKRSAISIWLLWLLEIGSRSRGSLTEAA